MDSPKYRVHIKIYDLEKGGFEDPIEATDEPLMYSRDEIQLQARRTQEHFYRKQAHYEESYYPDGVAEEKEF